VQHRRSTNPARFTPPLLAACTSPCPLLPPRRTSSAAAVAAALRAQEMAEFISGTSAMISSAVAAAPAPAAPGQLQVSAPGARGRARRSGQSRDRSPARVFA
jgi:hypothetical protein